MTRSEQSAEVIYHGWPRSDGQGAVAVACPLGTYRPLPHLVRHSPAGFNWGYNGNGPRDLALSLLADALDERAHRSLRMAPSRLDRERPQDAADLEIRTRQIDSAADCHCQNERGLAALPYLQFTEQVIAARLRYRGAWSLLHTDMLCWISGFHDRPPS
jgi:hypothetical protein